MSATGNDQLFLTGIISVTRLPNGQQALRIEEIPDWIPTREAAERNKSCEDVITNLCIDGTLTWRWKNHEGAGGTRLVYAPSLQKYIEGKTHIGRIHPQLTLQ